MVNQLEKKGFVLIERDRKDRRVLLLKTTEKNEEYWDSKAGEHEKVILSLFSSLDEGEIHRFHNTIAELLASTNAFYGIAKEM